MVDIFNYPDYGIYSNGKVFDKKNNAFVKPYQRKYSRELQYFVSLRNSQNKKCALLLSRLLAQHFIPNPNNFRFIVHIDGNVLNLKLSNLKWSKAVHFDTDTLKRMSEIRKGKSLSEKTRERISEKMSGKKVSKETRNKIRESLTGKKRKIQRTLTNPKDKPVRISIIARPKTEKSFKLIQEQEKQIALSKERKEKSKKENSNFVNGDTLYHDKFGVVKFLNYTMLKDQEVMQLIDQDFEIVYVSIYSDKIRRM
jgi:hypothetical protein